MAIEARSEKVCGAFTLLRGEVRLKCESSGDTSGCT